jgi:hypothetical protein
LLTEFYVTGLYQPDLELTLLCLLGPLAG